MIPTRTAPSTAGRFAHQVAVVTGGAQGIGRGIVERLASEGAKVAILDLDERAGAALADELRTGDVEAMALRCDVTDADSTRSTLREVVDAYGEIHVLVNNAIRPPATDFTTMPLEDWDRDVAIALRAPMLTMRSTLEHMTSGSGSIVNITSVNAFGFLGHDAYSASKAGLTQLTRSAAARLAPRGIRVNAVAPGTVATERWQARTSRDPQVEPRVAAWYPLGRVGQPSDIAAAVAFLASAEASWITGETLRVDGGLGTGMPAMVQELNLEPPQRAG